MEKLIVTTEDSGTRIDAFLAEQLIVHSRGNITKAIKDGAVLCNENSVKPSYRIEEDDCITYTLHKEFNHALFAWHTKDLNVVHEASDFLIIEKPQGMQVHPSHGEKKHTLVNALIARYPEIAHVGDDYEDAKERPGIVQRLDKDTSGIMVIARNQEAFLALKDAFKSRSVKKRYSMLVWGTPAEVEGTIDAPIARAASYTRQKVADKNFRGESKDARTAYAVQNSYQWKNADITHVTAEPHTGRMHQIRVHMKHIGHPLVGDIKYETKNERKLNQKFAEVFPATAATFLLHAEELTFSLYGKEYTFSSPAKNINALIKNL